MATNTATFPNASGTVTLLGNTATGTGSVVLATSPTIATPTLTGDVPVSGKLLTTAGLGVGNSAAGTTPGSVIASIEVFDASGTSLGFVPVYDAIT